jgi:tripartite-type tricarboxylate transporter receptor subunit TctC
MNSKRFFALMSAILALTLTSGIAHGAGPFYEGKAIRIIVGFSAGGGWDLYARALGRHMGKHIPGTPPIIVDNMPGAAGMISANYLYKMAKPDGLTIGYTNAGLFLSQFLEQPGIEFEARKFVFIGSITKDNAVCVLNKARGITTVQEWVASKTPVKVGTVGTGNVGDMQPRILKTSIGLPIQIISPYNGQSDISLAMERGEIDGTLWPLDSLKMMKRKALEAGDLNIPLQVVPKPLLGLENVPVWMSLAKTNEARQIVGLFDFTNEMGRPFTLPPGTPSEIVQVLRRAFQETIKDKEFLAEAEKAQMGLDPSTGEEVEKSVSSLFGAVDRSLIPKLKDMLLK